MTIPVYEFERKLKKFSPIYIFVVVVLFLFFGDGGGALCSNQFDSILPILGVNFKRLPCCAQNL